MEKVISHPDTK